MLRWDHDLVENLYGRDGDIDDITAWANSGERSASIRLVTGPGGAGKSALAAAAASELRKQGWNAGFIPRGFTCRFDGHGSGLFLILDYPEERADLTQVLFRQLAEIDNSEFPIRLLLLSRRDHSAWQADADVLGGRFGLHEISNLTPLSVEDGMRLVNEAATRFADATGLPVPHLGGAEAWLANSPTNSLPLFAAAAAIHAVLEPDAAFDLSQRQLLRDLARRERVRVRGISAALGLSAGGLEYLLALAVLGDGLGENAIRNLQGADAFGPPTADCVGMLSQTPWWAAGRLQPLQPDRLGAAFMELVLFPEEFPDGRAELPDWLFFALADRTSNLGTRLSRIIFDVSAQSHLRPGRHPLDTCLREMLSRKRAHCKIFEPVAMQEATPWSADFAAHIAEYLAEESDDRFYVAGVLNNASAFYTLAGNLAKSVAASETAVTICSELVLERSEITPFYAVLLTNHASHLIQIGRAAEALEALELAVTVLRRLASKTPDIFREELALALNKLANCLSALERPADALAACREAAAINEDLRNNQTFPYLERVASQSTFEARYLAQLGQMQEALEACERALDIYRELDRSRPDAFRHLLALSLAARGRALVRLGRMDEGVACLADALETLTPTALALPHAFGDTAFGLLGEYTSACAMAGVRQRESTTLPITQGLIDAGIIELVRKDGDNEIEAPQAD